MRNLISELLSDESGVTAVEYALLAAAAAGVFTVAGSSFYTKISTALEGISLGADAGS